MIGELSILRSGENMLNLLFGIEADAAANIF